MAVSLRESRVYVYKGWKKTRTRAHKAHVAVLLQVTAAINRSQFPFAFTFSQVGRARSVRIPVRVLRTGSERGVVETPKSPMEPIRSYLWRAYPQEKTPPATHHDCDGPSAVWGEMRLERLSAGHADAVDLDAHATTLDYQADQLALTSLNVDPVGDTAGRPTLAEAPELALALDPAVAPAVTGVGPDQGLRTYYVMFDNITGTVDFIRDER